MPIQLKHPYSKETLPWLKGNLHAHTTHSDGDLSPQETVDAYADLGHDFLMITDHDHFTPVSDLDAKGMVLIPGNEITAYGPHILHVNAHRHIGPEDDRQRIIAAIQTDGGFSVVCHPNWLEDYNHCDQENLHTWEGYMGIEIYNGVCRRAEGSPLSTDRWDRILSAGRCVWGFANDDCHIAADRGLAWNVVQTETRTVAGITRALREGKFYASTGVSIKAIRVEGQMVHVETENAQSIHVYSDHSRLQHVVDGSGLEFEVREDFPWHYVRIECYGPGDAMAWTQPFFVERV